MAGGAFKSMKLTKIAIYLSVLLMPSWAVAQAVDITGTWEAQVTSPQGKSEQTLTLKQAGDSFAGEMITSQGNKEAIKDGKVNGDEIEFSVERRRPSGEIAPVLYKGKVKGDEITGTFIGASGRTIEWTAKRGKSSQP